MQELDSSHRRSESEDPTPPLVTQADSTDTKLGLVKRLFCPPSIRHQREWHSCKTGKSGRQVGCDNEWVAGRCDKKTNRCATCISFRPSVLNNDLLFRHLLWRADEPDAIAVCPLLPDATCTFLCIEFEGKNYPNNVTAVRKVCAELSIPVSVERTRKGNSAHLWLFFSDKIPAAAARKLGSAILTQAMKQYPKLPFELYDRLIPERSTVPYGFFSKFVELPLQGQARKAGNSVFVDEDFNPYADQWMYLSSVKRMDLGEVDDLIAALCGEGPLGPLVEETNGVLWLSGSKSTLSAADFPASLQIIRANELIIPAKELSALAKFYLKRLGTFENPAFAQMQAMKRSTNSIPRIITAAHEGKEQIALPRGCEEMLCDLLEQVGVPYAIEDQTNAGQPLALTFNGKLREEQEPAAEALMPYPIGILSAATAFGKTVVGAYMIAKRKTNALVLVNSKALAEQWIKALTEFLKFENPPKSARGGKLRSPIGQLGGGKHTLHGMVDVALVQSVKRDGEVKELVRDYGMIIVDECHHAAADTYAQILTYANAKYVLGISATPERKDGHEPLEFMLCGPMRYIYDSKTQMAKQKMQRILIPRYTSFESNAGRYASIDQIYQVLIRDEARNNMIVQDVITALRRGRSPIILTERRDHVDLLAEMLSGYCPNILKLVGNTSAKDRQAILDKMASIPASEPVLFIATGQYAGEGFDYPRLDTLFLVMPISWSGRLAQYIGRLHRLYPGKTEVCVYDYIDEREPLFSKMFERRSIGYTACGYTQAGRR